jgi:hypothetical protein
MSRTFTVFSKDLILNKQAMSQKWHVTLHETQRTLQDCYDELQTFGLSQDQIPLIVKLVENPDYDYLPGFDIFNGGTNIEQHDLIHIVLGRGLRVKDEAFVLGFTAGSTNRVSTTEERLYSFFSKYVYPKNYQFSDDDIHVYKDAVKLGFISDCLALDKIDFGPLMHLSLSEVRQKIGLEVDLLKAYYKIEAKRYPNVTESNRNLI